MSLPDILPTGAMSSGVYTDYMITYLDTALESILDQLDDYVGSVKLEDWYAMWTRTVTDINTKITTLSSDVSKLKSQCSMVRDAIDKM